jgi:hypothetical protein
MEEERRKKKETRRGKSFKYFKFGTTDVIRKPAYYQHLQTQYLQITRTK